MPPNTCAHLLKNYAVTSLVLYFFVHLTGVFRGPNAVIYCTVEVLAVWEHRDKYCNHIFTAVCRWYKANWIEEKHLCSFTLLVPRCHSSDLQSLHHDADLLLTAPLYIWGHNSWGHSTESICSFSAPFLLASSVNHRRRYINDFKTRWDAIKRNYARFLSHASFNGLADFVWAQQCCYTSDVLYPQDTLAQHVAAVCVHVRTLPRARLHKYPSGVCKSLCMRIKWLRELLWITAEFLLSFLSLSYCFRIV